MSENIEQLLIEIELDGDVTGTIPIFNYNYNILNKNSNKNGNIYIPTELLLNNNLVKETKDGTKDKTKDKTKDEKLVEVLKSKFTSLEYLKNLYKNNKVQKKEKTNKLIKSNINFILNLLFKKNEDFYISGTKFKIKSLQKKNDFANSNNDYLDSKYLINKKKFLSSKLCSINDTPVNCNYANLEESLIESYKNDELKFINKIDPTLNDSDANKKAYRLAIEKYKKTNKDDQIEKFAKSIIENEKENNDLKKADIDYIYIKEKGIILNLKNNLRQVFIKLELYTTENIRSREKIYIKRGDCNTKKKYIKNLWKKFTRKAPYNKITQNKKWKYVKKGKKYELEYDKESNFKRRNTFF